MLTRANVTVASRIMLPTHAAVSLWIGAAWWSQDTARTAVPALYALREVWPIQATGSLLVAIGVLQLAAMLSHRRAVEATMVLVGGIAYLLLSLAVVASLLTQPASYSAPAWPLYIAAAHLATALSLAADEFTDPEGINRKRTR